MAGLRDDFTLLVESQRLTGRPYILCEDVERLLAAHPDESERLREAENEIDALEDILGQVIVHSKDEWARETAKRRMQHNMQLTYRQRHPKPTTERDTRKAATFVSCSHVDCTTEGVSCKYATNAALCDHLMSNGLRCTLPKFHIEDERHQHTPSSEVREAERERSFPSDSFSLVLRHGGRTALGLNPSEIQELWNAITDEIDRRIAKLRTDPKARG
jgi:hypothetical protein